MNKRRISDFWIDPQSNAYSASRFCLMFLVCAVLPALVVLEAWGVKLSLWTAFAAIVGSVAGAYGANSALRVWKGRVIKDGHPDVH